MEREEHLGEGLDVLAKGHRCQGLVQQGRHDANSNEVVTIVDPLW